MIVALGCDHGGYPLMDEIKKKLEELGHEYLELGCHGEKVDYPIYAKRVVDSILDKKADMGILCCGTGIGISMAANRHPGIRCANVSDCYSAKFTRLHNDSNILALGGRVVGPGLAKQIVETFVTTPFSNEEKHKNRIKMFDEGYEPLDIS